MNHESYTLLVPESVEQVILYEIYLGEPLES